jgi:hypothetical protein
VSRLRAARLGVLFALGLAACGGREEGETPPASATSSGTRHLVAGVPVGTIEGVVRLADGEEEPSYAESPFAVPAAGELPADCTPPQRRDRRPLAMDEARGLANVIVSATGDRDHWIPTGDPVVHEVHIHDCRLQPVTISATLGDSLHVINESTYPFMPDLGHGLLQAVLPRDPVAAPLDRLGPHAVQCAFAAPCGRMQVIVLSHPVHTVTETGGHFRIENAPADQDLTIAAWHPTVDTGITTARVTEGGTTTVEIVVHRFVPPAPETPPASTAPPPTTP